MPSEEEIRRRESKMVDNHSPEVRALIYEYGLKPVLDAIATMNTTDAARIEMFCKANRRAAQEKLENEPPLSVHEAARMLPTRSPIRR